MNQIALAYNAIGQKTVALTIWQQLMQYIEIHHHLAIRNHGVLVIVAYNYSRVLYLSGSYEEALEIAKIGQHAAVQYGQYSNLPGIYSVMAECYFELGNFDLSREKYLESYYIFKGLGNLKQAQIVRCDARRNLNLNLD